MGRSKIVLGYPPVGGFTDYNTPTGTLYVGTYLKTHGYDVSFIDCSVERAFHDRVMEESRDALCIGFYCMSVHIKYLAPLLRDIRRTYPEKPIILGGPHPSLFPESTIRDPTIDFVVRGEGEVTMLDLVSALERGETDFSGIDGICYEKDGAYVATPDRAPIDLDTLPFIDWRLMSPVALESIKNSIARLQTSRGCPYRCAFCINTVTGNRKLRYRSPKNVVDELEHLVKEYGVTRVGIRDEIFLTNRKQVREIAEGILARGIKVTWLANPHTTFLRESYLDDESLDLLVASGCNKLQGGGESGSQRVLDMLHKQTTPKDILNFVQRCKDHGILPLVSFLTGIPGETKMEQMETLRLIWDILKIEPRTGINGPAAYRPYPGGELYDLCVREYHLRMPETFAEWEKTEMLGGPRPPWLKHVYFTQNLWTHIMYATAAINGRLGKECREIYRRRKGIRGAFMAAAVWTFGKIGAFRLKHSFYRFPVDLWLVDRYWHYRGEIPEYS